jgi:hypothetical protein
LKSGTKEDNGGRGEGSLYHVDTIERRAEPSIGPRHCRFHAGVKVRVRLDHYYASETVETAVGMAIIQPQ